jgi:VWFA-related protein
MRGAWLLVVGSALAWLPVHAQQTVFSSRADAVRVDILVTRGNKPVLDLSADEFEVRDNGVLQLATLLAVDELPLNVVLALDVSESVAGDRLRDLRSAGRSLIGALTDRDNAALVTFGFAVKAADRLTPDKAIVRTALDMAGGGGRTALIDGCFAGLMLGSSELGRSLLLVFSDGVDTASWLESDAVLNAARRADVVTYAVTTDSRLRQPFLRDLTSATGGDHLVVKNTVEVERTFLKLLNEYRQRYLLSYTPTGVEKSGWHRIDVRTKRSGTAVRARPGYMGARLR